MNARNKVKERLHKVKACGHPSHEACCEVCGEWRVSEREKPCHCNCPRYFGVHAPYCRTRMAV